jgi:hypothetical protein
VRTVTYPVITITGNGTGTRIAVDGHDLTCVTSAILALDADCPVPVLRLSLAVLGDMTTRLPARVILGPDTAMALQAMGWAPPPPEPENRHD